MCDLKQHRTDDVMFLPGAVYNHLDTLLASLPGGSGGPCSFWMPIPGRGLFRIYYSYRQSYKLICLLCCRLGAMSKNAALPPSWPGNTCSNMIKSSKLLPGLLLAQGWLQATLSESFPLLFFWGGGGRRSKMKPLASEWPQKSWSQLHTAVVLGHFRPGPVKLTRM